MRKNRTNSKKLSAVATRTMHFGAVIVMLFVMVIIKLLASSSCQQLLKSIGEKERVLVKLEEERVRESARWEEMKTPEKLESALLHHGLAMRYPKPDQVVRMKANGRPYPGQLSVAKVRQRNGLTTAAYQDSEAEVSVPAVQKRRSKYRKVR